MDVVAPGVAVTAGAFAKVPTGIADLATLTVGNAEKKLGILDPNLELPYLTPKVDDTVDDLAGRPIPRDSTARAAFEGAVTAPLTGAKTAARLGAAAVGGGTAGATANEVSKLLDDPKVSPWLRIPLISLAALTAGKVAGSLPYLNGMTLEQTLAQKPVQQASRGVSTKDWQEGKTAAGEALKEGERLLPSQALPNDATGWQKLQGALLNARGDKANSFVDYFAGQGERVRALVERLKNIGGQTPRDDAALAARLNQLAQEEAAAGPKAVNAATKADYNTPLGSAWKFSPKLAQDVKGGFNQLIESNRGSMETVAGLTQARDSLLDLLKQGQITPAELAERIRSVKNSLPVYQELPGAANHVRGVVTQAVAPLEALIAKAAPPLARAQATQADLRSILPGEFDDVTRMANKGGDPKTFLEDMQRRAALVEALSRRDPLATQELLQRQVNNGARDALARDNTTGMPSRSGPIKLANELLGEAKGNAGIAGEAFQKNVQELLFRNAKDPALATEGLNRVLRVIRNASKEQGFAPASPDKVAEPAARLIGGSKAQQVSELGRQVSGLGSGLRANALIDILSRPDMMARLEYLAQMPPDRVTRAAVMGTLPQLFEGQNP